jgi:hypothetical protein
MRDGKEVELHTWDGPDDPDNPYGVLDVMHITYLTCSDSIGQ